MTNQISVRAALVLAAVSLCAPLSAANNYVVKDGTAATITKCSIQQSDSSQADCAEMLNGKVVIATSNFTAPSGGTIYAAGQLIANSATAGSVTPMSFTVCRVNAGNGTLWRARIKTTDSGFSNQSVLLKLYKDSPTVANGDHGAWSTTESNYLGSVPVTLDQAFTDSSGTYKGIGAPLTGAMINYDCGAGVQTIYGLLVANSNITPVGAKVFTVALEVTEN